MRAGAQRGAVPPAPAPRRDPAAPAPSSAPPTAPSAVCKLRPGTAGRGSGAGGMRDAGRSAERRRGSGAAGRRRCRGRVGGAAPRGCEVRRARSYPSGAFRGSEALVRFPVKKNQIIIKRKHAEGARGAEQSARSPRRRGGGSAPDLRRSRSSHHPSEDFILIISIAPERARVLGPEVGGDSGAPRSRAFPSRRREEEEEEGEEGGGAGREAFQFQRPQQRSPG